MTGMMGMMLLTHTRMWTRASLHSSTQTRACRLLRYDRSALPRASRRPTVMGLTDPLLFASPAGRMRMQSDGINCAGSYVLTLRMTMISTSPQKQHFSRKVGWCRRPRARRQPLSGGSRLLTSAFGPRANRSPGAVGWCRRPSGRAPTALQEYQKTNKHHQDKRQTMLTHNLRACAQT